MAFDLVVNVSGLRVVNVYGIVFIVGAEVVVTTVVGVDFEVVVGFIVVVDVVFGMDVVEVVFEEDVPIVNTESIKNNEK